jgi:hypothetical protein
VSRRQLRSREATWEGSWRQDLRADEQKPHTRRDPRASQHNMAKPDWHEGNVNAVPRRASALGMLLETVATMPQTGRRTPETRGLEAMGHSGGPEPKELLAPLPHDGNAVGHERRMAQITGPGLRARLVDRVSLPGSKSVRETCRITVNLLNRRMRTRKLGAGS